MKPSPPTPMHRRTADVPVSLQAFQVGSVPAPDEIEYPSSDGKRMSENDWQLLAILVALEVLRVHFAHRPDVYVSGDLLIFYEKGNPRKSVAPDVFVVFGAPKRNRMNYKLWDEPAPAFALEVASPTTWRQDRDVKRKLYEQLGFTEYWRFDPKGDFFEPRLQGLRLDDSGSYRPVASRVEGGRRMWRSESLKLDLWLEAGTVRFRDPATGRDLRTLEEAEAAREKEATARKQEAAARARETAARQAAEALVHELRERLRDALPDS